MASKKIRIGTRDSILATWQAETVQHELKKRGYESELVFIKTEGDRVLDTPLPLMGGKGVFTKALDDALLAEEVDIAVHSLKDIPTTNPEGLRVSSIMKREDPRDVLVARKDANFLDDDSYEAVIATSSNRRGGQWINRYPNHKLTDIRGNVHTRLRKLSDSTWDGAIFAAAGLIRVGLDGNISTWLDWMIPAPGQGAVAIMSREGDRKTEKIMELLHDPETALCTRTERRLLQILEGGCSAPLGAFATLNGMQLRLQAVLNSVDGKQSERFDRTVQVEHSASLGEQAAEDMMSRDTVMKILSDLRKEL